MHPISRPFSPLLPRLRTLLFAILLSLTIVRPAAAVDYTDLWVSQSELGWGVNFDQSDTFIFATFFIYDANQQPTWYSGELTLGANGVWSGPLYRSTGSYYGGPWSWAGVDRLAVRGFLAAQQRRGLAKRSVARALSALRTFYRFLNATRGLEVSGCRHASGERG